jgi:molybdate transport system substrate-binding protein
VKAKLISAAMCCLLMSSIVQAAEIKLLASSAVKDTFLELIPQFEKSSGHKVATTWGGTVDIKKRLAAGEVFDLVIVGAPVIDENIKEGRMVTGSRVDFASSGVGMAVKAGAPKPDISSGVAVKKALLAAKMVAYSTGSSGSYVQRLFDKLGIADQMKDKSKQTVSPRRVADYIAKDEADLGFQQVSELVHEVGIEFLGPLPADIQNVTVFSSGIPTGLNASEATKALQVFLTSPAAAPVIRKNGMEPSHM